jgi:hypothetical protein
LNQQSFIAVISFVQIPVFAEGAPFVSHWKLPAGSLARQSMAAVTMDLHQLTSFSLYWHTAAHSVLVLGQAIVSVAHRVAHSSGAVVVVVELVVELVVWVEPPVPEPPVLVLPCVEPAEQAASDAAAAMHKTSEGTKRGWTGAFRDSIIGASVAPCGRGKRATRSSIRRGFVGTGPVS